MYARFVIYNFDEIYNRLLDDKHYEIVGRKITSQLKKDIQRSSERVFDKKRGLFNASIIEQRWFPHIPCDIFVAYSHKDYNKALSFVGWLYEHFGIMAFLDAAIWRNIRKLREMFVKKYIDESDYDPKKETEIIVESATAAKTILDSATMKMIKYTECFVFIGTKNAFENNETCSPYIKTELEISGSIERTGPDSSLRRLAHSNKVNFLTPNIKYDIDLKQYSEITLEDLLYLYERRTLLKTYEETLSELYRRKGL